MRFLSTDECTPLIQGLGGDINLLASGECIDTITFANTVIAVPGKVNSLNVAKQILHFMAGDEFSKISKSGWRLLLIVEQGIWPSSENLHLQRKLRAAYGEFRELIQAPGHAFRNDELSDLISFLHLALDFGYGGYLIGSNDRAAIFFSHDSWVKVRFSDSSVLEDLKELQWKVQPAST